MNKWKERFKPGSRRMLAVLVIVCVGLMAATLLSDFVAYPVRTAVGYAVTPFQSGVNKIGSFLSSSLSGFADAKAAQEEIEDLKAQVAALTDENNALNLDAEELERLRKLYDLDKEYAEYTKIGARVIGKDPGNWYSTFTIDKGSDDGIAADMNVITDGGLVGIVTSVGKSWAEVRSIINDESSVSAIAYTASASCIVSGSLSHMASGVIDFSDMSDEDDAVTEGTKVVTSSISSKYLPGILIGSISTVTEDENHLTKSGTIVPSVDFRNIEEVFVIKELKQTKENSD